MAEPIQEPLTDDKPCDPPKYCKPQLKELLKRKITVNVTTGILAGLAASMLMYYFVNTSRKQRYAEFYKNYDPDAVLKDMKKKKLLQSVK